MKITKKGIKGFIKGGIAWNKEKKLSKETCLKMKGRVPWNKGKPNPELSKRQIENNVAKRPEVREKMSKARLGVRPWNWNGGGSRNRKYTKLQWRKFAKEIYKRDDWTCFDCGKKGGTLNAHHLKPWSRYPQLAFDEMNIITLCLKCHASRHYQKKSNRFCKVEEVMQ